MDLDYSYFDSAQHDRQRLYYFMPIEENTKQIKQTCCVAPSRVDFLFAKIYSCHAPGPETRVGVFHPGEGFFR